MSEKGFYITTAIAYPNNRMHVGFGWEAMGSDMVARFHRMRGREVFFCTGVDEHSQNVEKAAIKAGESAKAYCDRMADDIRVVMQQMDIAYDRFIRTSDPDHERVAAHLIEKSKAAGYIEKKKFEGLYCDSCEVFYTEKELVTVDIPNDPKDQEDIGQAYTTQGCPIHSKRCRIVTEENYFFKLSAFGEKLRSYFKSNPEWLAPENRRNEITSFLENDLRDFSVSRTTFKWGIPIPFDKEHIIYVWFDALVNYLSAVKYLDDPAFFKKFWPCDVHVIGKDITRFHCIYWPAMLWSTGIELPKKVFAHGFININGEKMSKTRGNMVTPDDVTKDYGATALRWYMLSANPFDNDGNYGDELLVAKCNADLANNIGNLVNRTVSMTLKYFPEGRPENHGSFPPGVTATVGTRMKEFFGEKGEKLAECIEKMDLSGYCQRVIDFSMSMNKFIDEAKPWSLAKLMAGEAADPGVKLQLESVLCELLEGVRNLAVAMWPVTPEASVAILGQIGISTADKAFTKATTHAGITLNIPKWSEIGFDGNRGFKLEPPKPLFPRLEFKAE